MKKNAGKASKPNKSKNSKSGSKNARRELSPNVAVCPKSLIPSIDRFLVAELDCYTTTIVEDLVSTTSAGGVINDVYSSSPSTGSNWANAALVFDEYRVLAMRITYIPYNVTGVSFTSTPVVSVIDNDTATALTGYTLASQYSSVAEHSAGPNTSWSQTAYMSDFNSGQFRSTGSPVATYWIKLYSTGNTASVGVARVQVKRYVQFRGKGI